MSLRFNYLALCKIGYKFLWAVNKKIPLLADGIPQSMGFGRTAWSEIWSFSSAPKSSLKRKQNRLLEKATNFQLAKSCCFSNNFQNRCSLPKSLHLGRVLLSICKLIRSALSGNGQNITHPDTPSISCLTSALRNSAVRTGDCFLARKSIRQIFPRTAERQLVLNNACVKKISNFR